MSVSVLLRTAWRGLLATPLVSAIAIGTIGIALLLVGAFALLVTNMERLLDRFGEDIRVSAFLEEGLDPEAHAALVAKVEAAPGVERVHLVTKERALERFRESLVGRAALVDGLDENPLPASLEITLVPAERTKDGLDALAAAIEGEAGIAELGYGHEWVDGYAQAVALVRGVGTAIGAVLALATLLIVGNTIRLSIYGRSDEIEILQLVGASRPHVAIPFLLEGLAQGLLGGLLGLGLLALGFEWLAPQLASQLELLLGWVTPGFLTPFGCVALLSAGALLGALGSAAALGRLRGVA